MWHGSAIQNRMDKVTTPPPPSARDEHCAASLSVECWHYFSLRTTLTTLTPTHAKSHLYRSFKPRGATRFEPGQRAPMRACAPRRAACHQPPGLGRAPPDRHITGSSSADAREITRKMCAAAHSTTTCRGLGGAAVASFSGRLLLRRSLASSIEQVWDAEGGEHRLVGEHLLVSLQLVLGELPRLSRPLGQILAEGMPTVGLRYE